MPGRYMFDMHRTASATLAVGALNQDGTTPRRASVETLILGSEATPGDTALIWRIARGSTSLGTSSAVTPTACDPADPASIVDCAENHTANPGTVSAPAFEIALNQRSSFQWSAVPGSELILPATANASILILTPTSTAIAVTASMFYQHH